MVQIVAVLTSLAFGGVILVVLGLIFFGGGGTTVADQQLSDAKALVEENPKSADAWESLASAYSGADQLDAGIAAAKRAVALEPDNFRRLQTLVSLQVRARDQAGAIETVQVYTARNPDSAEAFLQLGGLAEDAGRTPLARLSYLAFLRLAPDDPNAAAIKTRLKTLSATAS